jgi:hypothetical protein
LVFGPDGWGVFLSPGVESTSVGLEVTGGVLVVDNMSTINDYPGTSLGGAVSTGPIFVGGVEIENSMSISDPDINTTYIGGGLDTTPEIELTSGTTLPLFIWSYERGPLCAICPQQINN